MGNPYDGRQTDAWACGVVLFALITEQLPFDELELEFGIEVGHGHGHGQMRSKSEREERKRRMMRIAKADYTWPEGVGSEGVKRVVERLLVRDRKKRARVDELWNEDWMSGPGSVEPPGENEGQVQEISMSGVMDGDRRRRVMDGVLVDGDGIDEVALAEESDL